MFLRFIDITALSSGQRLDIVNRTHLVLASGNLVLKNQINVEWLKSLYDTELIFKLVVQLKLRLVSY